MIRFHQTFGAHAGRVTEFDEEVISFGRMPDCDVSFDAQADLDASGRHAEVVRQNDAWHVIDAGSRNGTWLNGQKVQRAVLSTGDEIEFGMGGPRVRIEIVQSGVAGPRQVTGPMTPAPGAASPNQMTAPATPIPGGLLGVDVSAATVAAMATPVPVTPGVTDIDPPTSAATPGAMGTPERSPAPATPLAGGVGPPATPPAGTPGSSPKQYGQRTVGLMIEAAIAQQAGSTRAPRSTDEIRAIASQSAGSSGGGLKIVIGVLVVLLMLVIVGGIVTLLYVIPRGGDETGVAGPSSVDPEVTALRISSESAAALYVLVELEGGTERALCAAFAVRSDLLATTAKCVLAMQAGRGRQATHFAVLNGGGGQRMSISQMWHHPGYAPGDDPTADVGIVQVVGAAGLQLPLASMTELASLSAGDPIFVFGFATDLDDTAVPVAEVTRGTVRGLTAFDGSQAQPPLAQVLQHDVSGTPLIQGSPVFDASGQVIAIDEGRYAIRVDLVSSLLAGMGR